MATAKVIIAGEDRSKAAFASASKNAGGFERELKKLATGLAAFAGAAAIKGAVQGVLDFGDRVGKLSLRLNVSTEALSEYRHALALTGVSFDTWATALQRQTRRISEAAKGTGAAAAALQELGLEARALAQLAPEQQFEALADAFAGVATQGDKVRLAMKIWDTEGVSLLQTIEGGSKALRGMRQEARDFGLSISEVAANNIQAANDAMERFSARINGIVTTIVTSAAPGLEFFADILQVVVDRFLFLGQAAGGVAATLVQFITGEFAAAWETAKLLVSDAADSFVGSGEKITQAWARMEERTAAAGRAAGQTAREVKAAADVMIPAADSFQAVAASAEKAADSIIDAVFSTKKVREETTAATPAIDGMARALVSVGTAARNAVSNLAPVAAASTAAASAPTRAGLNHAAIAAPSASRFIFTLGSQRTLVENGKFVYRLKPSDDVSQVLQGIYATGTSRVPNNGLARVEAGERIVSNNTTISINFPGVPSNPGEFRQWVRGVLVPELRAAGR